MSEIFANRHILLGVTGGIAAYKAAELASMLHQAGAVVDVVMTDAAKRFIQPLTFKALTRRNVYSDMFEQYDSKPEHIALSDLAELVIIAPTTGNTLAKLANGIADNLLSSTLLACEAPILAAPAMNNKMWNNPATQDNCAKLAERGVHFVGPAEGYLACGTVGKGRMSQPVDIFNAAAQILKNM